VSKQTDDFSLAGVFRCSRFGHRLLDGKLMPRRVFTFIVFSDLLHSFEVLPFARTLI